MPVEKNQEYIVEIIDNGYEGEGIAKIENFTIFIPNSIKGEKVRVLIVKVLKSHAFGKVLEIIKTSEYRKESDSVEGENPYGAEKSMRRCSRRRCHQRHLSEKYDQPV